MASYHCSAKMIGRSAGKTAIGAAAYRSGTVLTCPETGVVFDYSRKGGILAAYIIAPDLAPKWATDRQALWSAVHGKEKRKNSQLCREIEVALPHELTAAEGAELVRYWVRDTFVSEGMVADVAIHDPEPRGDGDTANRHAHILLTTRELDDTRPDGWASNKCRAWNDHATLEGWRESWAEVQNTAFAARGLSVRVDHRSLEDQQAEAVAQGREIDALLLSRDPEPRLGVVAGAQEAKGQPTERGEALRAAREHRTTLYALADHLRVAEDALEAAIVEVEVADAMSILSMPATAPTSPEEPDDMHDRTKTVVERQLRGMGLPQVEISITGIDRPSVQTMTPTEIIADLPRLKRLNKAGGNIYVRGPRNSDHDLILLDDIDAFTPKRMEADGLKPAVVVETSPGNHQAWIKLGEPTPANIRREAAFILAERYGGDLGAADGHQSGRLAGFTNAKPKHRSGKGAPFVLLNTYAGKAVTAVRDLIEAARSALATKVAAKAVPVPVDVTPAPNADADLIGWFRAAHAAAEQGKSLSEVDWHLTHLALGSGRTAEDVAAALEATADRKGDHAHDYAVKTVSKAVAARQDYAPPSDDDTPSPF